MAQTVSLTLDEALANAAGRVPTGVGVVARVTLSAHALNNEGSRNNALMPRQVDVVTEDGTVMVNAISGDTIKHSFVDHLIAVIGSGQWGGDDLLPLSDASRRGDPNRLNADETFRDVAKDKNKENSQVAAEVLRRDTVTDLAGILVTEGGRNVPRHSVVRFGWQLGIPERVTTGRYTHVKLVPSAPASDVGGGTNLGQNIFTRPASSGDYAFVSLAELDRIGVSDLTQKLEISEAAQRARSAVALEALYQTVVSPGGAQRNTQLPHLQGVVGAVSLAFGRVPPVLLSPLTDDYIEEMARCTTAFGRERDLAVVPFDGPAALGTILHRLAGLFASHGSLT